MTTAIEKAADKSAISYIPFGSDTAIKLSLEIVQNIVAVKTKSGATCSRNDALKFIAMCQAQKLNPFAGDAYLIGYDSKNGPTFSLITSHSAFLKRAEVSPDYDGMLSGVIVYEEATGQIKEIEGDFYEKDQVVVGGWAKVFHKRRSHPTYRRIRMERFNKGYGQWEVDAAGMICKTAEADALRSTFPTMLGALYMEGERNMGTIEVSASIMDGGSKLVKDVTPSREEQPPQQGDPAGSEQPEPKPAKPAEQTPQDKLAAAITNEKYSFEDFIEWMRGTGNLKDGEQIGSFDEVKTADATRFLRIIGQIVLKIKKLKG